MKYITPEDYQAAEENGISYTILYNRVHSLDWDMERATTEPVKRNKWLKIAKENGINPKTFYSRVYRGVDEEIAATLKTRRG